MTRVPSPTAVGRVAVAHTVDVLVIDDNPGDAVLVREMLRDAGGATEHVVGHAPTLRDGLARLRDATPDCVLLDLGLPDADGLTALAQVRGAAGDVPVVVLSGREDEDLAVRAVHDGAQDYLVKGQVDARLLGRSITYAI